MKIYNSTQNNLIASESKIAKNFIARSVGLIKNKDISKDEALIIKPCCSIHTFFMKFDIDVIFVNKNNEIIAIYENIKPFKILPIHMNSFYVIELAAGKIRQSGLRKGDAIGLEDE